MKIQFKLIILSISLIFLAACGSSVESEQGTWDRNKETVKEYAAAYPFYKNMIDKQFEKAELAMTDAKSVKDEEKKIAAMSKANKMALDGAVSSIIDLENAIEGVEKEVKKIKDDFTSEEFSQKTNFLLEQANIEAGKATLSLLDTQLSPESAVLQLEKWSKKLDETKKSLTKHYTEIQSNRKKDEKVAGETVDTVSTTPSEPAAVNCKKCGGKVKSGEVKCANCGAPVK